MNLIKCVRKVKSMSRVQFLNEFVPFIFGIMPSEKKSIHVFSSIAPLPLLFRLGWFVLEKENF